MTWLIFTLMTALAWGSYGICMHIGQSALGDPVHGRYKSFLFVGVAYFLTAVLAPMLILWLKGATWSCPVKGIAWSILGGTVGAIGAFCVLLAFETKGSPSVVMTLVFGGAPVVNAILAMVLHPPSGGWGSLRWQFVCGIILAIIGACMVTLYKPELPPKKSLTTQTGSPS